MASHVWLLPFEVKVLTVCVCGLCVWESASSAGTLCSSVVDLSVGDLPQRVCTVCVCACVCVCVCVMCVKMCTMESWHSVQPVEVLSWLISSTAVRSTHRPSELWHTKHTQSWVHCVDISHTHTTVMLTCPSDHSHVLSVPLLFPLFNPWNYSFYHQQLSIVL